MVKKCRTRGTCTVCQVDRLLSDNASRSSTKRLGKLIFSVDAAKEGKIVLSKGSDLGNRVQDASNDSSKLHD